MVFQRVKYLPKPMPKLNLRALFLYFLHVFECLCSWYIFTSSKSFGFLVRSESLAEIILSTHSLQCSLVTLLKTGAFKTHKNDCICGLPLTWNSNRII